MKSFAYRAAIRRHILLLSTALAAMAGPVTVWAAEDRPTRPEQMAQASPPASSTPSAPGDATTLPTIAVEGEAGPPPTAMIGNLMPDYPGGQVARGGQLGLLGNRDFMDTPFSTTSYTQRLIQDQQARSIADVLDNDPSVRSTSSRGSYDTQFMIRGFPVANDDISYNGLYGILPRQIIAPELAERVEVFKGPSALLGGMNPSGSVGGNINIVPKRAADTPLTQLTLSYLSDSQFGSHIDIGRRAGANNQYGIRFNGLYRDGETSVEDREQEFGLAVLGLDLRGERVRISVDGGYQKQDMTRPLAFITLGSATSVPSAPDAGKSFVAPWSFAETEDTFGVVRGEIDLTDRITAFAAIGGRRSNNTTFGQTVSLDNAGNFGNGGFGFDGSYIYAEYNTLAGESGLRGEFDTGMVRHSASVAVNVAKMEEGNAFTFFGLPASNIYNPSDIPEPSHSIFTTNAPKTAENNIQSIALADTLSILEDRVQWTLGVRQQRVNTINFDTTGQIGSFNEHALTPATGLVVKPWENVSLYGSYIEGLSPGEKNDTVGLTNRGQYLAPYRTEQMEVGVKVDHGGFATTLGLFQIAKPNGIIANNTFTNDGEQRNRGVELSSFGALTDHFRILGGITVIDAEQTKTAGGVNQGKRPVGVPEMQANFGVEWDTFFDRDLTLTGRVIYTGSQYYDAANTQSIPSWTRVDLGARYRLEARGTPITIRAAVENVFDEDYWASTARNFNTLSLGAPRTFLVSTTFDF